MHSQIVSTRHNHDFQKKLLYGFDSKKRQEFRLSVHSVQQATSRKPKTQV